MGLYAVKIVQSVDQSINVFTDNYFILFGLWYIK